MNFLPCDADDHVGYTFTMGKLTLQGVHFVVTTLQHEPYEWSLEP